MADKSTKRLVDIAAVRDDIVLLKDGSLRSVIKVSAINFDLRSDEEQIAIIQNFQRFLNSIDFPVQIVINSRRYDIEEYLKFIDTETESLTNDLLRIQAAEYSKFIKDLSTLSNIMSKKFYVAVPFYVYENPAKLGLMASIKSLFTKAGEAVKINEETLATFRNQLVLRSGLVIDNLIGLGLRAKILQGDELTNLFYGLYNPDSKTVFSTPQEETALQQ